MYSKIDSSLPIKAQLLKALGVTEVELTKIWIQVLRITMLCQGFNFATPEFHRLHRSLLAKFQPTLTHYYVNYSSVQMLMNSFTTKSRISSFGNTYRSLFMEYVVRPPSKTSVSERSFCLKAKKFIVQIPDMWKDQLIKRMLEVCNHLMFVIAIGQFGHDEPNDQELEYSSLAKMDRHLEKSKVTFQTFREWIPSQFELTFMDTPSKDLSKADSAPKTPIVVDDPFEEHDPDQNRTLSPISITSGKRPIPEEDKSLEELELEENENQMILAELKLRNVQLQKKLKTASK